jgi:folylpolyglutamate synthase/dihydropteroate synthase
LAALKAIDDHFGSCHRVVVFASSRDKDYAQMLKHILEHCDRLIVTAFQENPRAVAPGMLCDAAVAVQCERGKNEQSGACRIIEIAETPALAWQRANAICPQNGLILAIGSFFLAAELMASLNIMHGESTV